VGSYRARTHQNAEASALGGDGGPGWSLGVINGRHIANHSTARLCHRSAQRRAAEALRASDGLEIRHW
jgi:hypothetical protein